MLLAIPFALPWAFGKMAGNVKQGLAILTAMFALWLTMSVLAMAFEARGNPRLTVAGADQRTSAIQAGGNMEGKEPASGPRLGSSPPSTTETSSGSVRPMHFRRHAPPLGGICAPSIQHDIR